MNHTLIHGHTPHPTDPSRPSVEEQNAAGWNLLWNEVQVDGLKQDWLLWLAAWGWLKGEEGGFPILRVKVDRGIILGEGGGGGGIGGDRGG